ncbi:MAG: RNA polymerase sigma factor [Alphaproteobacteria bacterium]|nr:MAG: RNA polymerase sigma factor [Alphaproteobacteria bacterium]
MMGDRTARPVVVPDAVAGGDVPAGDAAGRQEAVESLFREHNRALLAFLRARLATEQEARDVAQEAYVKLLQLDRPQEISFLRAYLYKIAANLAIDHQRKQRTQDRIVAESALFDFAYAATQHRALEGREALDIIKKAIAELPPACRQAFILSRAKGWSSTQIGEHLNTTDRTARNYIVRALEHIQLRLSQHEPPEGGRTGGDSA